MFLEKIMNAPYALTAYLTVNPPGKRMILATGLTEAEINQLFSSDGAAAEGQPLEKPMQAVKDWGAGGVSILQVAFIFLAVAGVIVAAASIILHSNKAQELSEDKKGLVWKIIAIVLGAAAVTVVIFLAGIANSTATTTPTS